MKNFIKKSFYLFPLNLLEVGAIIWPNKHLTLRSHEAKMLEKSFFSESLDGIRSGEDGWGGDRGRMLYLR